MLLNDHQADNLDTFIDEDPTVEEITRLRHRAEHIESVCGPSLRTKKLRDEIAKLENELSRGQVQSSQSIDIFL